MFGLPPGEYYVSATLRSGGPEVTDPMGELSGYAALIIRARPNIAEATRVTLAVSQENTGVNFGLIATRLVRVVGAGDDVRRRAGDQRHGDARAGGRERRPGIAMQQGGAGNRIDQTGAFRLPTSRPAAIKCRRAQAAANSSWREWISSVGAEDVEGLTLVTAPGAVISGTSSATPASRSTSARSSCRWRRGPASPDTQAMGAGAAGRLARRRRLVVHAAQRDRRRDRPRVSRRRAGR